MRIQSWSPPASTAQTYGQISQKPTSEPPGWAYYEKPKSLGATIREILLEGLGYSPTVPKAFAKCP